MSITVYIDLLDGQEIEIESDKITRLERQLWAIREDVNGFAVWKPLCTCDQWVINQWKIPHGKFSQNWGEAILIKETTPPASLKKWQDTSDAQRLP